MPEGDGRHMTAAGRGGHHRRRRFAMLVPIFVLAMLVPAEAAVGSIAGAPEPDAVARFLEAVQRQDLGAVKAQLDARPGLAGAKGPGSPHLPAGGSAVLTAALVSGRGGFQAPRDNAVLQEILARKPDLDFFDACVVGRADIVSRELERDPSLARAWHPLGWSALHLASFSGEPTAVERLLARGAAIDARAKTRFRNTPLQTALLAGQQATARVLLEGGADPLVRQSRGFTPLQEAALLGRRDLVDLLLDHGAEIDSRADDGRTALTEAERGGHAELAAYLRSKGAHGAQDPVAASRPPE
jgi:hypothetical protein